MRARLLIALLAVAGLTAFAPAPFLKPPRHKERGEGDLLAHLQGTWSITSKVLGMPNGRLTKYSTSQKVVIDKGTWQYTSANVNFRGGAVAKGRAVRSITYQLSLEPGGRPRVFRVKRSTGRIERDYMVGIVAVEGDSVKMLYRLGSVADNQPQPTSFDQVPTGWYLMTLKRAR